MKNNVLLSLILCLSVFMACKNDTAKASTEQGGNDIPSLEKALETSLDKDKAQQLIGLYQQYVDEHPEDKVTNASYLYRMAALHFRQNQYPAASGKLMTLLRNYKGSKVEASAMHLLADLYKDHLNYPTLAQDLYQYIAAIFPSYEELASVKKNIAPTVKPLGERIAEIAGNIYDEKNSLPNTRMARKYIAACEVNGLVNPNSPQAAELLFKAAMTARTTGRNPQLALDIYDWVYRDFTAYDKSYQALFLKAFTLDNDMKKIEEARTFYQEFLNKYPDDEFAVSTKFLLENLGKSDDEIIKQFEKKE